MSAYRNIKWVWLICELLVVIASSFPTVHLTRTVPDHELPLSTKTMTMALTINLAPVTESDLPILARIQISALQHDLLHNIIFENGHDYEVQSRTFMSSLQKGLSNPDAYVFKATDNETKEIVGFAHWIMSNGVPETSDQPTKPEAANPLRSGINQAFYNHVFEPMRKCYSEKMQGKSHLCWFLHIQVITGEFN